MLFQPFSLDIVLLLHCLTFIVLTASLPLFNIPGKFSILSTFIAAFNLFFIYEIFFLNSAIVSHLLCFLFLYFFSILSIISRTFFSSYK
jgi:hypothetical protein